MDLLVEIDGGLIEGEIRISAFKKNQYYSFKGVPYARPPVGSLRFQPPEHVDKWDGVIKCTEHRDMCCQRDALGSDPKAFLGSEDCLYLNVYTPVENPKRPLMPVMVFIHGGAFQCGNGNTFFCGPDYLVTKGVVLVTINYRLNIFGFLNLGIKECPGNVGLLDQRAALIWVKKNIQKFNGDPANVTIFGESAGSACVHYHLISPLSKGLYHKAILQSGCSLNPWAYLDPVASVDRAFRVGKYLGCRTTDPKELFEFLLAIPAETLYEATRHILTPEEGGLPFLPSKEIVGAVNRLLPDDPKALLTDAPEVPLLCGFNNAEGLLAYYTNPQMLSKVLTNMESVLDSKFPKNLQRLLTDHAKLEEAKSKVRQFYATGNSASESDVARKYVDFFGDISFGRGYHQMLKAYLSSPCCQPIYLYLYDFESNIGLMKNNGALPDYLKGACHADELSALFKFDKSPISMLDSEAGTRVVENMTTLWSNFAKFGNPNGDLNINWKPITVHNVSHCRINEKLEIQPGFMFEERMQFWDELSESISNQA